MKNIKRHLLSKTHFAAMKAQLVNLGKARGIGRILKDSAFGRIPTAASFELEKVPYNPLLELLGIKVRLPSKKRFTGTRFESSNRYMAHVIARIRKLVSQKEFEKAGNIALLNIKYSQSFRISSFNHVCSGGYYSMAVSEVYKYLRKTAKLIRRNDGRLDYRRVYIPKANGKLRPLGVPTVEWRIMLHLYNGFFQEILKHEIGNNQHAYLPGRGVMSAGREIIEKIEKYDFVYETDLKSFFPSVSIFRIREILERNKMPQHMVTWFLNLCKSIPKFCQGKQLDESKFDIIEGYDKGAWSLQERVNLIKRKPRAMPYGIPMCLRKDIMGAINRGPVNTFMLGVLNTYYYDSLSLKNFGLFPGGVPQGMPLSPFLSILTLKEYLGQQESVNYADDQIFFGNEEFFIEDIPAFGIVHAREKCNGIKYKGRGTDQGLKFLGFKLSEDGTGMSTTRNGIEEKVNPIFEKLYDPNGYQLNLLENLNNVSDMKYLTKYALTERDERSIKFSGFSTNKGAALRSLGRKNILGFVMACMNLKDGKNETAEHNKGKTLETFIGRLHKKSLTKKIPTNLDSSSAIEFLAQAVQGSLLKKRKEVVKRKTLTIKLVLKNRKARIVQTKIRVVKKRRSGLCKQLSKSLGLATN